VARLTGEKLAKMALGMGYLIPDGYMYFMDAGMSIQRHHLRDTILLQSILQHNPHIGRIFLAQRDLNRDATVNTRISGMGETVHSNNILRVIQDDDTYMRNTFQPVNAFLEKGALQGQHGVPEDTLAYAIQDQLHGAGWFVEFAEMAQIRIWAMINSNNVRLRYPASSNTLFGEPDYLSRFFSGNVVWPAKADSPYGLTHYTRKTLVRDGIDWYLAVTVVMPFFSLFPSLTVQHAGFIIPTVLALLTLVLAKLAGAMQIRKGAALVHVALGAVFIFLGIVGVPAMVLTPALILPGLGALTLHAIALPLTMKLAFISAGALLAARGLNSLPIPPPLRFFLTVIAPAVGVGFLFFHFAGVVDPSFEFSGIALGAMPWILFGFYFAEDKMMMSLLYYTEHWGKWRGLGLLAKDSLLMFMWYVFVIPLDYASNAINGRWGRATFIGAPRTGGTTRLSFRSIYDREFKTIRKGVVWLVFIAIGLHFNFHPVILVASGLFILSQFNFLLTAFLWNPHESLASQVALGIRDGARVVMWSMYYWPRDFWLWFRKASPDTNWNRGKKPTIPDYLKFAFSRFEVEASDGSIVKQPWLKPLTVTLKDGTVRVMEPYFAWHRDARRSNEPYADWMVAMLKRTGVFIAFLGATGGYTQTLGLGAVAVIISVLMAAIAIPLLANLSWSSGVARISIRVRAAIVIALFLGLSVFFASPLAGIVVLTLGSVFGWFIVLFGLGFVVMVFRGRTVPWHVALAFLAHFVPSWTDSMVAGLPLTSPIGILWVLSFIYVFVRERHHLEQYFSIVVPVKRQGADGKEKIEKVSVWKFRQWTSDRLWQFWKWEFEDRIGRLPGLDRPQGKSGRSSVGGAALSADYVIRIKSELAELNFRRAGDSVELAKRDAERAEAVSRDSPAIGQGAVQGTAVLIAAAETDQKQAETEKISQAAKAMAAARNPLVNKASFQASRWRKWDRIIFKWVVPLIVLIAWMAGTLERSGHAFWQGKYFPAPIHYAPGSAGKINDVHIALRNNNPEVTADGKVIHIRNGGNYQYPEDDKKPNEDYKMQGKMSALVAPLLDRGNAVAIQAKGTGLGDLRLLMARGIFQIRFFNPPLDNSTDVANFITVLDEAYKESNGRFHVILVDDLDLDQDGVKLDWNKLEARVTKLATTYNSQPWLAGVTIANEADMHVQVKSPNVFMATMVQLAGRMREVWKPMGITRPIFLGHSDPADLSLFIQLENFDGVSLNLYQSGNPEALHEILSSWQTLNQVRSLGGLPNLYLGIGEFGELAPQLAMMSKPDRIKDLQQQIQILSDPQYHVVFWDVFSLRKEGWKKAVEGDGAERYGIIDDIGLDFLRPFIEPGAPIASVRPSVHGGVEIAINADAMAKQVTRSAYQSAIDQGMTHDEASRQAKAAYYELHSELRQPLRIQIKGTKEQPIYVVRTRIGRNIYNVHARHSSDVLSTVKKSAAIEKAQALTVATNENGVDLDRIAANGWLSDYRAHLASLTGHRNGRITKWGLLGFIGQGIAFGSTSVHSMATGGVSQMGIVLALGLLFLPGLVIVALQKWTMFPQFTIRATSRSA